MHALQDAGADRRGSQEKIHGQDQSNEDRCGCEQADRRLFQDFFDTRGIFHQGQGRRAVCTRTAG